MRRFLKDTALLIEIAVCWGVVIGACYIAWLILGGRS